MRVVAGLSILLALAAAAGAQPLRLRADALASAQAPVGLMTLEASGRPRPWLRAESLVWVGGSEDGADGDALVIAVRARDPRGRGDARLGRFVLALGALRPLHLDGAEVRGRLPGAFTVELFGGMPVVPREQARAWDWAAGGRVGRRIGDWGSAGVAWMQRRDHGRLADEEVAVDAGASPRRGLDLGGRVSYDRIAGGLSEALVSAAGRRGPFRLELFGIQRSPSRILPATSLFSVLGDVPSRRAGATLSWRAAPRLDLRLEGGAREVDEELAAEGRASATLRLDERGEGAILAEVRRDGGSPDGGGWSGARASLRVPVRGGASLSTELELVVPDEPAGRGDVWPWGLVAASWPFAPAWEGAVAVEGGASPQHRFRVDVLARLARRWEAP